jgi:hypothetical protein
MPKKDDSVKYTFYQDFWRWERLKMLELKRGVYYYYKHNVRGNRYIDFDTARKKLSRNVELATSQGFDGYGREILLYGNLEIVVKDDKIIWIQNHKGENMPYKVDEKRYDKLNKKYGLQ